jgi:hypothetical protein
MDNFTDYERLRWFTLNVAEGDFGYLWYGQAFIETRDRFGKWHCHSAGRHYSHIYSAFEENNA